MKGFNILFSDRIVKRSVTGAAAFIFVSLVYVAFFYRNLPPLIPVFNQLSWGTERLGERFTIFFPIGISIGILLGNMLFSQLLYEKMPLVVRMISITTFFICFITFIFVVRMTLLII